ncbi:hypothetical protein HYH02_004536 [Chlamydomonas schloesseri]|uniref:Protein kinase domain-containing protein n=1 Tax=Chlamydomonas schloesseri TaxID=2026947 RepID=A0A836B8J1_9CHLO|nr:hypothetical protein HYH02_004536 [Chlamydomonas schloesseri]|eukprot:KAG2450698.1 hypothetical protein HYH02_004536 [Chlamydomonas schloesseri]
MAEEFGSSQRYTYIQLLGRGTYGAVVKCAVRDAATASAGGGSSGTGEPAAGEEEQYVAIKAFHGAYKEKQGLKLALREARVLRVLDHPGVVKLLDAFKSPSGRPYLVLEYLPRCVATELDARPSGLSRRDVKLLSWQLASVIRYLHTNRVVHRDVKPANILLTDTGVLKLCDFGFARFTSCDDPRDGEALTSYVVTRWYRAPEVLLGQEYGPPADIWSFGCTVAEMAMGVPLLPGTSTADQLWRIISMFGPLPPEMALCLAHDPVLAQITAPPPSMALRQRLAELGPRLLELLEVCLRPDPRERPTAEELMHLPYFFEVPNLVLGCPELEALYEREAAQLGIGPSLALFPRSSTSAAVTGAAAAAAVSTAGAGHGAAGWPGADVGAHGGGMAAAGPYGGAAPTSPGAASSAARVSASSTGATGGVRAPAGADPNANASGASDGGYVVAGGATGSAAVTAAMSFASDNPQMAGSGGMSATMPEARAFSGPASGGSGPSKGMAGQGASFVPATATAPSTIETSAATMLQPQPQYHRNVSAPDPKAAEMALAAVAAAASAAAAEGPVTHDPRRGGAGAGGASSVEVEVPFAPVSAPMGPADGMSAAARAAAVAAAAAAGSAGAGLLPGERHTAGNVRRADTTLPPGAERSAPGAGGGGSDVPVRHTAGSRPPAPFSSRVRRAFGAAMSGVSRRRRGEADALGSPPPPPPLEDVRTSNQTIIGYPRMSHGPQHSSTGDGPSGSASAAAVAAGVAGGAVVGGASVSGAECASGVHSQSRSTLTRAATAALQSGANSLETNAAALLGAATSSQRGGASSQNPGSNPASLRNTTSGAATSASGSTVSPLSSLPTLKPHLQRAYQQQQQQQLLLPAQGPSGKTQQQQHKLPLPLHPEHPHESPRQEAAPAPRRGGSGGGRGSFLGRLCGCLGGADAGAGFEDSMRGHSPAGGTFSMDTSSMATMPTGTSAVGGGGGGGGGDDRPSAGTQYGGDRPSGGSAAASVPFTYTASGLDDSEPYWYSEHTSAHTSANPPSQWSQHGQSQHSMIGAAAAELAAKSAFTAGGNSRRGALAGAIDEAGGADA